MNNFNYYNPCKIVFGDDVEKEIGQNCLDLNVKKVLLHYGGGSIKKNGLYEKVIASLKASNIQYVELAGVKPNPRLELVREGIAICKKENVDLVLAVGGGSVIDSAKAIACGFYVEDIWEYYLDSSKVLEKALPLGVVLTIPAAGSETSSSSVITEEATNLKRSAGTKHMIAKFAIMNPKNTYSLPDNQIAYGVSDMFAHIMERYFSQTTGVDLGDRLLEANMKNILRIAPLVFNDKENYTLRAEIMWAGTLAHNGILGMGRDEDWASHLIEHELSGEYDIPHGLGLAIVFPAWMKYVCKDNMPRFTQFASRVFGIEYAHDNGEYAVSEAIKAMENFYKSIGLHTRLSDISINADKFDVMAERLFFKRGTTVGQFKKLNKADAVNIFNLAK